MPVRVIATKVKAKELQTGDLFSFESPGYWAVALTGIRNAETGQRSVCEMAYVRTDAPITVGEEKDEVTRITLIKEP